jgi:hypothetical protein
MTEESQPTTPTLAELEMQYLTALMSRDAKVFADRTQARDKLTARPAMQAGAVKIRRVADATGCPGNMSPVEWLLQTGWLAQVDGGFAFVKKVCLPRREKKVKHRSRARECFDADLLT